MDAQLPTLTPFLTHTQKNTKTDPLFVDFTWGAGGSTAELTLELTIEARRRFGLLANMHLTCTNMPTEKVTEALKKAKEVGITNILALRGGM